MSRNKLVFFFLFLCISLAVTAAKEYKITSPDKKINVTVRVDTGITWQIDYGDEVLLKPSGLSMTLSNPDVVLGERPSVRKVTRKTVDETIEAVVPAKSRQIRDHYNEMNIICKGDFTVSFRVYNNGAAYRFETNIPASEVYVKNEKVELNLGGDYETYWPREKDPDMITHCEGHFEKLQISDIPHEKYAYLPIYLSTDQGTKIVIMDADLFDYPNLFLYGTGGSALSGKFPPVILEKEPKDGSDRNERIIRNTAYIAKTGGKRTFPWRLVIINEDDRALLENNLVYQLSSPAVEKDTDWIKPGKISWEWWSGINVYGVDFEAGVNTDTYKYFIDFASTYGIEYILLDEGWSVSTTNIREPRKEIDMQELVRYGNSKNVGLVLWALWKPLEADIEGILDVYRQWGIKGIKVDFMQRSDQDMVNYYENVAKAAFYRKLLVDFHGSYKPSGVHCKYPNVMTFEGVYGMENNKSSYDITPNHDLILPFTRMVAGPMDYTPGATVNAAEGTFCMSWTKPMSQSTRAHQGALYVVFESPLQMLADTPSHYYRTPDFTQFIAQIPTVWDETKAISGKIGEYAVVTRRNGKKWYIGALTNWDARNMEIILDFIDDKKYKVRILQDGVNANTHGSDFKIIDSEIAKNDKLEIKMAKGGGWAAILTPID